MIHRPICLIYLEKVNDRVGYRGRFHLVGPLAPDKYHLFWGTLDHDLSFDNIYCPAQVLLVMLFNPVNFIAVPILSSKKVKEKKNTAAFNLTYENNMPRRISK